MTPQGKSEMKIAEIQNGMKKINIEGKVVNMNEFMLVLDDGSGSTFVRYNSRNLAQPIRKGDRVSVKNGEVVNYSGILQVKLSRSSLITIANC
jgi:RNase P/RNase MRP subunit p29